jgi:uncharacterized membrane protein YgdD (TMEM256/DUF423 family)
MKTKTILIVGAVFMFTAVVLGALGAHALQSKLSAEALVSFKTGVRYQAWHGLALLFVGLGMAKKTFKAAKAVAWLFMIGTLLFSVSIYFLSTQNILGLNLKWLGPITPVGGLLLIAGWGLLILKIARQKHL